MVLTDLVFFEGEEPREIYKYIRVLKAASSGLARACFF